MTVRRTGEIRPFKIVKTPAGDTVVDMGQNLVGWVRLKVEGPAGTTVTLRHAEVLDKQGNFYTENLRAAKQTIRYTRKGAGAETFEPHFTFQGFRHVAVSRDRVQATAYANRVMEEIRALEYAEVTKGLAIEDLSGDPDVTTCDVGY